MSVLKVQDVVKSYGNQLAVDHINFTINKGEIVGFLGPNGAGKSTTMKMIAGILTPDHGTIEVNGSLMTPQNIQLRKSLAYLPEQNPMYGELYVRESLEFMMELQGLGYRKEMIDEAIEACGLQQEQFKQIQYLSKGYKQRVGLAQSILHHPDLYILDEATTGLDPNQILDIRALIKSLGKEHAVLISTHILQEVESICHRCIVIHEGKIIADDDMNMLKSKLSAKPSAMVTFDQSVELNKLQRTWPGAVTSSTNSFLISDDDPLLTQNIFDWAVTHRYKIQELKWVDNKIEDVFHELTGKNRQSK